MIRSSHNRYFEFHGLSLSYRYWDIHVISVVDCERFGNTLAGFGSRLTMNTSTVRNEIAGLVKPASSTAHQHAVTPDASIRFPSGPDVPLLLPSGLMV